MGGGFAPNKRRLYKLLLLGALRHAGHSPPLTHRLLRSTASMTLPARTLPLHPANPTALELLPPRAGPAQARRRGGTSSRGVWLSGCRGSVLAGSAMNAVDRSSLGGCGGSALHGGCPCSVDEQVQRRRGALHGGPVEAWMCWLPRPMAAFVRASRGGDPSQCSRSARHSRRHPS